MNTIELLDESPIETLDALQVISDGQRHRIVTLLIEQSLTARELAKRLGIARTRLYYHLDLLEKHGFVRVTETKLVSGIPERTYRATARTFRVNRALLSARSSGPVVNDAQASILDAVASDLRAQPAQGPGTKDDPLVVRAFLRLSESQIRELRRRLGAVLDEYRDAAGGSGSEMEVALAVFPAPGAAS